MTESSFQEKTAAAKTLFGVAAKLAQKQAELAKLNNVTLPKLYHAIGKRIVRMEELPTELGHHRENIRTLEAGIAATLEEIKSDPTGGFAAKAKEFAQQAAQKAAKATGDAAATVQIQAAYVSLGKDALERCGSEIAPKELQAEFLAAIKRREQLTLEIENSEKTLSSKNMPSLLVLLAALLFGLAWVLPFAKRSHDVAWGGSIALSVLREGWLAIVLCVGANAIALASLWLLLARPARSQFASWGLTLGCGIIAILNVIWGITFSGDFFIGYFAWLTCFAILFMELSRSVAARPRSASATLLIAGIVAACLLLGPTARSTGKSLINGSRSTNVGGENSVTMTSPSASTAAVGAGDATANAWNSFFDTLHNLGRRRDGELESERMGRELAQISQIQLKNVEPALAKGISAVIDLQKERIMQCKQHETEILACERKWAERFAKAGQMAADVARSPEEEQLIVLARDVKFTKKRNEEVLVMNKRWGKVHSEYDKKSSTLFKSIEDLRPTLEQKYRRQFPMP